MKHTERQNNLIYDVGLHKGGDTEFYLKKGFDVVAFEADPNLIQFCQNKFQKEIEEGRLNIVEGAIIEPNENGSSQKITFYRNNSNDVWGTVVDEMAERNKNLGTDVEIISVEPVDFGKCLEKYGVPYYLKIDIEGMDRVCLKALSQFEERPAYVSMESERASFVKLEEDIELFVSLGYDRFQIVNQAKMAAVKEPLNSSEGKYLGYKFKIGNTGLFGKDLSSEYWTDRNLTSNKYKRIFRGFKVMGDNSLINKVYPGRMVTAVFSKLFGFPGWYDTHAKHNSVS